MSDYELYGDYNSTEEDREREAKHTLFGRMLKWLVILFLFLLCGFLIFRIASAGYYPRAMKTVYRTEALVAYEAAHPLHFDSPQIDVPYDDNKNASFMADNLFVSTEAGALQCSVRINNATMRTLAERLSLPEVPPRSTDAFTFVLTDNRGSRYEVSYSESASYLWYSAVKLCFDGIDFFEELAWLRLEIGYAPDGVALEAEPPYAMIPVYVLAAEPGES